MKTLGHSRKRIWVVVVLLSVTIVLSGCVQRAPAQLVVVPTSAPTMTAVPPADTPIPPTDTPIPPTNTPVSPTNTPTATPVSATATPIPPTATPLAPTATPIPTDTPAPTATPTPAATKTPKPTPKPRIGKILMTSNRVSWDDIYVMNDDGSKLTQLTTMGKCYSATFTPDGKTIFFEHEYDLWKMNADGSGQTNISNTPDKLEDFPTSAPDGTRVAYLFAWPGGFEIYTMKPDGTDAKPLTSREFDLTPAWSPDSKRIAFARATDTFNIWMINRDGSDLKQITQFGPERLALTPVFSPDGKQIAFSTIAEGTAWEIWVVGLDGSNPHKVQGAVGNNRNNSANIVAWKKGKFLIGGWEGNWEPYYVPEAGGPPVKIISGTLDDKPSDWWLP